ncbi:hypothetical protein SAMN04489859_1006167 [Paracoccus alcaliphilus]|uniref:Core-binding (CB) domain-containing protein n=1 Tax=Paracoccus alcaliphilus TaxID=34002 RepID=A0A1H8GFT6_9RHOB|nr:hypothetical protein JHW40_17165 [Paracoccus alcaliphilus]SEN42823.1 hypothetical protein SAMN04489859_1006167 [Paracoccus alcaliphilus]
MLEHFRGMLERFKDGIADAGPIEAMRLDALKASQSLADVDTDSWAGLVHPDGADGLLREFCALRGIPEDDLSADNRAWLLDAMRQGHQAFADRALGHVDTLNRFDLDMPPPDAAHSNADPAPAVDSASYHDVQDQYFTELDRTGQLAAKTMASKREALALLGEITDHKPIAAMTKADARQVKDILLRYPKNRNKLAATKDKPLSEILDLPGIETIAPRTVNASISSLQTFFGWAVSNGHASENIFDGTRGLCCTNRVMAEVPPSPDGLIPQLP